MTYTLLDNRRGVLVTRAPLQIKTEHEVFVEGAPDMARIVFVNGENKFVRYLDGGNCSVPFAKMDGVVSVCVRCTDKEGRLREWKCDGLCVVDMGDDGVLVLPDDSDLAEKIAELSVWHQKLHDELDHQKKKIQLLAEQFQKMFEGWDI